MADQELVNYVKKSLASGTEQGAIRKTLLNVGWPPADIDEAFFFLKQDGEFVIEDEGKGSKDASHKSSKPKKLLIISISLFGVAALVLALHAMGML